MNAVGPLLGTVIDPAELARYVLQFGFGIKNPEKFMVQGMGEQPPPEEGAPPAMTGNMEPGPIPEQVFEATGGVPPELLSQLQGQMGMELPNL